MAAYCLGCHSSGGTSPALDTLARVKANYAKVLSQVQSGGMPLSNTKVPADKVSSLSQWGSPSNPYGAFAP